MFRQNISRHEENKLCCTLIAVSRGKMGILMGYDKCQFIIICYLFQQSGMDINRSVGKAERIDRIIAVKEDTDRSGDRQLRGYFFRDQADPVQTKRWAAWFRDRGYAVLEVNAKTGEGTARFSAAVRTLLQDKIAAWQAKGQVGRTVRVMVLGIPNVGKSTFINRVAHRKTARAEDRPGVTRSKQWVPVDQTLELLDTPGILWPKFDDPRVGMRLAFTGAIKDDVVDLEDLASRLMDYLHLRYPDAISERYKLVPEDGDSGYDLLTQAARKRGFLMRGGAVDTERMARILLDEFRAGRLGRFTLETVEDLEA